MLDWEYHTAHMYFAFCQVLEEKLDAESRGQVISTVRGEFKERFGAAALDTVDAYAGTDFFTI